MCIRDRLDLAQGGPEPLRPPIARYARRAAQIGSLGALEAVRQELADPVSDQVLLTLEQAVTEGTETVLRTLQAVSYTHLDVYKRQSPW